MELAPYLYPQGGDGSLSLPTRDIQGQPEPKSPGGAEVSVKVNPPSICDDNGLVLELEHCILAVTKADKAGRAEGRVVPPLR